MENKLSIEEQLYCLKYEFDALSELVTKRQGERWVHNCIPQQTENEHLERYKYACLHSQNKKVLDIAGGSGYGTFLLATNGAAKEVHSVDLDEKAVKYANIKYNNPSIKREIADATNYVKENYYDVIVSFETIEHLKDYTTFLNNVHKSLAANGHLIISTPIALNTTTNNINKYHTIEWSFLDFQNLLQNLFDIKEIYVQSVFLKSDMKHSLFSKMKRKLFNQVYVERKKPVFEKYTGQYKANDMIGGFQLVHCIKK